MRRILAIVVGCALLLGVAAPAFADGGKGESEVKLKTKRTAAVVRGDTAWVAVTWTAKGADAQNFQVTATTAVPGVTITYPANTGSYTSLMTDATLSAGELDFTSLRIHVPYTAPKKIKVDLRASWDTGGAHHTKTYKVQVPTAAYTGADLAAVTTNAGTVPAGGSAWLGVEWTGMAPALDNVAMTAVGPPGTTITYPAYRAFTSLAHDATLEDGETDVARFLLDAGSLAPGTYAVDVTLTYTKAGAARSVAHTVTFDVVP